MKRFVLLVSIILCTTAFAQNKHNASTPKDPATFPLAPEKKGLVMDGKIQDSKIYFLCQGVPDDRKWQDPEVQAQGAGSGVVCKGRNRNNLIYII